MSDARTRNEGPGTNRVGSATPRRWWGVVAWMGLLFVLSAHSELPRPSGLGPDLTAITGHFAAYAVLAATMWWALPGRARSPRWRLVLAFLGALAYGASDEWHQSFVPGRHPAFLDLAVDAAGAAGALLVVNVCQSQRYLLRRGLGRCQVLVFLSRDHRAWRNGTIPPISNESTSPTFSRDRREPLTVGCRRIGRPK